VHQQQLQPIGRFEWERLIRRAIVPPAVKLLALVLATYADPDGTRVRPGTTALAAVTGGSDRTVRRHLTALRQLGLLQQVSRGGGHGGSGITSEYRLTVPLDLLERVRLLGIDDTPPAPSPATQMAGQPAESPATAVAGQDDEPATRPATQMADENDLHRPNDTPQDNLTGHLESHDRPPRWPTTSHDQPPTTTTHLVEHTANPPTAREPADEPDRPPLPPRCAHGSRLSWRGDGTISCAFCRRGIPATAPSPPGGDPPWPPEPYPTPTAAANTAPAATTPKPATTPAATADGSTASSSTPTTARSKPSPAPAASAAPNRHAARASPAANGTTASAAPSEENPAA